MNYNIVNGVKKDQRITLIVGQQQKIIDRTGETSYGASDIRKKDMVEKSSQMKQRAPRTTIDEKTGEIPSETGHDWANAPTTTPN